jgi:hypothetical protein
MMISHSDGVNLYERLSGRYVEFAPLLTYCSSMLTNNQLNARRNSKARSAIALSDRQLIRGRHLTGASLLIGSILLQLFASYPTKAVKQLH